MSGCQECERRSIEPNCHNIETCEYWARHMAAQEKKYDARKMNQLASRTSTHYAKNKSPNGGQYIRGVRHPKVPKGRTIVKGEGP